METNEYQNQLMHHTEGLISGEKRNWFGTNYGSKASIEFEKLVAAGLSEKRTAPSFWGDDVIYSLTEKGMEAAKAAIPESRPKPKLSKSKARYQRYLEYGDMFESFIDFCRWDAEPERIWNA